MYGTDPRFRMLLPGAAARPPKKPKATASYPAAPATPVDAIMRAQRGAAAAKKKRIEREEKAETKRRAAERAAPKTNALLETLHMTIRNQREQQNESGFGTMLAVAHEDLRVVLCVQWYQSASEDRQREIDYCVRSLLANSAFHKVLVFVPAQNVAALPADMLRQGGGEVEVIPVSTRMMYSDAVKRAVDTQTVYIIANSDMVIPEDSVRRMCERLRGAGPAKALCLSRWESSIARDPAAHGGDPSAVLVMNAASSQDIWAFRGGEHVRSLSPMFPMGMPACDNKMAWWLGTCAEVSNPCMDIRTYHVHDSRFRTYTAGQRLAKPWRTVAPEARAATTDT
jgi:hypothetical protein